jgi:hypothetical protein
MKKPVDSLKVLAAAIALGVLVNTGCTPTFAKRARCGRLGTGDRDSRFAVYATCMAKHGQIFG